MYLDRSISVLSAGECSSTLCLDALVVIDIAKYVILINGGFSARNSLFKADKFARTYMMWCSGVIVPVVPGLIKTRYFKINLIVKSFGFLFWFFFLHMATYVRTRKKQRTARVAHGETEDMAKTTTVRFIDRVSDSNKGYDLCNRQRRTRF